MTMLLMEGFEGYADVADVRRGDGRTLIQSGAASLVAGRLNGGQALHMSTNNQCYLTGFGTPTTFVFGFALRFSGTSSFNGDMIRFYSLGSEQLVLRIITGGKIFLDRSTINLDDSAGFSLNLQSWHYLEFKATIDNSVGAYELKVDGVTVMSDTGVDTQTSANAEIDVIQLVRNSSQSEEYDDMYLLDDQGLDNNDFIGDVEIQTQFPDGDGNQNDFTPDSGLNNWEMVDDGNTPDDDSTFNSSSTLNHAELYTMEAMVGTFDTVFALQVRNHLRKENAGLRTGRALIRSNTDQSEGAIRGISTEYRYFDEIYENDPQGGGAWTETRLNALETGFTIEA